MKHKDKKWLCIIPARGGSKGLKDKNIRTLYGQPLIYWAIKAAKDSGLFDSVVVNTDSTKIAKVAKSCDTEVYMRPKELAKDNSHVMDAIQEQLHNIDEEYDYVCMHHATNPVVTGIDLLKAGKFMVQKNADFVLSVCESDVPLGVARPLPEDRCVKGWFPEELRQLNRQQISQTYQLDGNIYMGRWDVFYENKDYWDTNIYAYVMPRDKYCDINDEIDFKVAEMKMEELHAKTRSLWSYLR